jgi:tetratricopeptide (TPR) repeat protein
MGSPANFAPALKRDTPVALRASSKVWLTAACLLLVTSALYWPATHYDFVNYDDPNYVTANTWVQSGLNWEGVKWAFLNPVSCNWHPLTMLSHMLDCQMFGLNPRGHHLTSVLLHAVNSVLVFAFLRQVTGATLRSLFVAVLFAVHPLRVESVAWVAERKDLLSGFFGLLTLICYTRYAQKCMAVECEETKAPETAAPVSWSATLNYLLALLCFALGLMSKPILVTWPCLLLLLDYWPLGRFQILKSEVQSLTAANDGLQTEDHGPSTARSSQDVNRLLLEKAPFFLLAAVFSVVSFVVQKQGGAVRAFRDFPLAARCANALISYCRYLGKLLWPTRLAVYYPHPGHWALGMVLLAGGLVLGVSALLFVRRRRAPFLLIGWLWFCGTLVPVIGLVQVGGQAMADRYTYLPSLGVLILAVWGAYDLTRRWRYHGVVLSVAGSVAIVICLALTRQQLGYWKDSEVLFRHAVKVTEGNYLAHNSLGTALDAKGQADEAIRHYQDAIRLKPDYPEAHYNLGNELARKGDIDEAIRHYQEAIRLKPDYAETYYNLGLVLTGKGRMEEAIRQFQAAIRVKPDYADAHFNLAMLLARGGRISEAINEFQAAIRLRPFDADAHNYLGLALAGKGQIDEAITQYRAAIRLKPDYAEARNNLARALELKNAPASPRSRGPR